MQEHPEVDAVTVGTGWTGAVIAQQLTEAGLDVVSLERGKAQWTSPDFEHNHDYLKYFHRLAMMQDLSKETWTWRPHRNAPALPMREHAGHRMGQGLGGSGVHWAAISWRFQPMDFRFRSHLVERYGEQKLPEGNLLRDWPVTYDELEPFYDRWEYDTGVSGQAGNIQGQIVDGGNPFEGPRSRPFPLPPVASMVHAEMFADACRELGYHPFIRPTSILSRGYTDMTGMPRAACLYCGFCETFGCEVDAKGSPLTTYIPMALDTGRYEIRTHSTVVGIEMNDRGVATGLRYIDRQGREHFQPAARVFLTGFTYTNIRLLLLSRSRAHPDGVGNNNGLVGTHHTQQMIEEPVAGVFPGRRFHPFMGNAATGHVIYDYQADVFDHTDLDFIGGAYIQSSVGGMGPLAVVDEVSVPYAGTDGPGQDTDGEQRQWGQDYKGALYEAFNSTAGIGIHAWDMSHESRFYDLDPTYTDSFGLPLLRLTYEWTENDRNMYRFLADRCEEIMRVMGPERMHVQRELDDWGIENANEHPTGGAIMGTGPSNSVTNKYGQVWDAPNVFVTGAALFPQNPGANPTETICALAYFTADAIKNGYLNRPEELMG